MMIPKFEFNTLIIKLKKFCHFSDPWYKVWRRTYILCNAGVIISCLCLWKVKVS